ncbi:MAG: hypothetical protein ACXVEF_39845 [Polyangiales bacterium]
MPKAQPEKPPLFPRLFVACARGALVAILLINLYYAFGASGFRYRDASFSFGREHDKQLFAIDDKRAFEVTGHEHPYISVVKYAPGFPLFRLCGKCVTAGGVFPWPRYKKGNWVYTDMPWIKGPAAYNLVTEELVKLSVAAPQNSKIDPEDVPFYAEHGFTFDDAHKLDVDKVAERYEPISTVNEMCTILQMAAFLIIAILIVVALILLPFGLRKRRAAART